MVEVCKCCGAVIPPNDAILRLTHTERRIYSFVARRPECTMEQIVETVYKDDPDGGPPSASNVISVLKASINKKLTGHQILASRPGPGATYRLVKTK